MISVCEDCTYYLHRIKNEDKQERVCMIDRTTFDKDDFVTRCNFFNPMEVPEELPNVE